MTPPPQRKICPQCNTPTHLQALQCGTCGRVFRTQYDASGRAISPSPSAPPPASAPQPAQLQAVAHAEMELPAKPPDREGGIRVVLLLMAVLALVWWLVPKPKPLGPAPVLGGPSADRAAALMENSGLRFSGSQKQKALLVNSGRQSNSFSDVTTDLYHEPNGGIILAETTIVAPTLGRDELDSLATRYFVITMLATCPTSIQPSAREWIEGSFADAHNRGMTNDRKQYGDVELEITSSKASRLIEIRRLSGIDWWSKALER